MTGKAYKRAMRGHLLVASALTLILMQELMPETAIQSDHTPSVNLHGES